MIDAASGSRSCGRAALCGSDLSYGPACHAKLSAACQHSLPDRMLPETSRVDDRRCYKFKPLHCIIMCLKLRRVACLDALLGEVQRILPACSVRCLKVSAFCYAVKFSPANGVCTPTSTSCWVWDSSTQGWYWSPHFVKGGRSPAGSWSPVRLEKPSLQGAAYCMQDARATATLHMLLEEEPPFLLRMCSCLTGCQRSALINRSLSNICRPPCWRL